MMKEIIGKTVVFAMFLVWVFENADTVKDQREEAALRAALHKQSVMGYALTCGAEKDGFDNAKQVAKIAGASLNEGFVLKSGENVDVISWVWALAQLQAGEEVCVAQ